MKKDFNSPEEKKIMKSMISDHNKQHKGTSNEIKTKVVKKMGQKKSETKNRFASFHPTWFGTNN